MIGHGEGARGRRGDWNPPRPRVSTSLCPIMRGVNMTAEKLPLAETRVLEFTHAVMGPSAVTSIGLLSAERPSGPVARSLTTPGSRATRGTVILPPIPYS